MDRSEALFISVTNILISRSDFIWHFDISNEKINGENVADVNVFNTWRRFTCHFTWGG